MSSKLSKAFLLIFIGAAIFAAVKWNLTSYLSLDYIKSQQDHFSEYYQNNKLLSLGIYFFIYVATTALSLPGAAVLTLLGGALFGLGTGLVLVSFASTIGGTLAFLTARFALRDWVEKQFKNQLKKINQGVEKDGAFYLFSLRLIPVVPFFVINLAMGLTKMRSLKFYLVSQVGMLPGTAVYVNAGTQLGQIESLSGIASPGIIASFALLGLFPLIAKKTLEAYKAKRVYKAFKKPKSFDYNIVAIGAGAAGLVTSYIGAAAQAKVALIEKHKMGGDCLNTGCVPSKALIRSAKLISDIKKSSKLGIKEASYNFDYKEVKERIDRVIKKIEPHDSVERYTNLGVDCLQGEAKIISPWEVKIGDKTITTKNIVIATGARPLMPPIPGLDQVSPLSSDNLWDMTELPKRLLVLGGGAIGCELSQSFARLGAEVYQMERSDRVLPREEPEASQELEKHLVSDGVNLMTSCEALSFEKS